jgi:hypothetical protein
VARRSPHTAALFSHSQVFRRLAKAEVYAILRGNSQLQR